MTSSQPCITIWIVSCLGPMRGPKSYTKVPILQVVISFRMKLWPVALFFHSLLESGNMQNIAAFHFFTAVQEMTCCNVLYVPRFQKWVKKMGNRSEFQPERNYYLQNWYFNMYVYKKKKIKNKLIHATVWKMDKLWSIDFWIRYYPKTTTRGEKFYCNANNVLKIIIPYQILIKAFFNFST